MRRPGRIALIEAGAAMLGLTPADCIARTGVVSGGGKSLGYGQIVAKGLTRSFTPEELAALPLKPATERRLIGQPVQALDIAGKIDGTTVYGIDAKLPGMVHARPLLPPTRYGSTVTSVDDTAARGVAAYLSTLTLNDPSGTVPGWVMVLAETCHPALAASDLIKVTWTPGASATVTEALILDRGRALIADPTTGAFLTPAAATPTPPLPRPPA